MGVCARVCVCCCCGCFIALGMLYVNVSGYAGNTFLRTDCHCCDSIQCAGVRARACVFVGVADVLLL